MSEQETIISIRADEEKVNVYSTVPVWWRRAEKARGRLKRVGRGGEGKEVWREYELEKGVVKFRAKRKLTEAQMAVRRESGRRLAETRREKPNEKGL